MARLSMLARVALAAPFLACATSPAGRGVGSNETPPGALQFSVSADVWEASVKALVNRSLPSPQGGLKTASLALSLRRVAPESASPPEIHAFRRATTAATGLREDFARSLPLAPGGTPLVLTEWRYELPETGDDYALEQLAIFFDPERMSDDTNPATAGIQTDTQVQIWSVRSTYDAASGATADAVSAAMIPVPVVFRRGDGRVGAVENLPDGRVALRFAPAPRPNGPPVDFVERALFGLHPISGIRTAIAAVSARNDLATGGLWVVVAGAEGVLLGALSCLTGALPDDCERNEDGDGRIHPFAEVFR